MNTLYVHLWVSLDFNERDVTHIIIIAHCHVSNVNTKYTIYSIFIFVIFKKIIISNGYLSHHKKKKKTDNKQQQEHGKMHTSWKLLYAYAGFFPHFLIYF